MSENLVNLTATIKFIDISGGFFAIESEKGDKLNPINLPPEFQQQGLKIQVSGFYKRDFDSVYMWGDVFEITDIKKLGGPLKNEK